MPEISELYRLREVLDCSWINRSITGVSWPIDSPNPKKYAQDGWDRWTEHVLDHQIAQVLRLGKNLWINFAKWHTAWHIHLSSTGWFLPGNDLAKRTVSLFNYHESFLHPIKPENVRLSFNLDDGQIWNYHDPRTWGKWWLREGNHPRLNEYFKDYGPDWIDETIFAESQIEGWDKDRRKVKDVLTDQHVTAGLGNYLACEILHRSGTHPAKRWDRLEYLHRRRIAMGAKNFLVECLQNNDHSHWKVFRKKGHPCTTCGNPIQYEKDAPNGNRGSYFCGICQPI